MEAPLNSLLSFIIIFLRLLKKRRYFKTYFLVRILSSAFYHLHFPIRIFPSAFSHPYFPILILSSAFCHPHFIIRILSSAFYYSPSAVRHPPSAAIWSSVYRDLATQANHKTAASLKICLLYAQKHGLHLTQLIWSHFFFKSMAKMHKFFRSATRPLV